MKLTLLTIGLAASTSALPRCQPSGNCNGVEDSVSNMEVNEAKPVSKAGFTLNVRELFKAFTQGHSHGQIQTMESMDTQEQGESEDSIDVRQTKSQWSSEAMNPDGMEHNGMRQNKGSQHKSGLSSQQGQNSAGFSQEEMNINHQTWQKQENARPNLQQTKTYKEISHVATPLFQSPNHKVTRSHERFADHAQQDQEQMHTEKGGKQIESQNWEAQGQQMHQENNMNKRSETTQTQQQGMDTEMWRANNQQDMHHEQQEGMEQMTYDQEQQQQQMQPRSEMMDCLRAAMGDMHKQSMCMNMGSQ